MLSSSERLALQSRGFETWSVGEHRALFAAASGAVVLANETASAIWSRLHNGMDADAIAMWLHQAWGLGEVESHGLVGHLVETWRAAGVMADGPVAPVGAAALPAGGWSRAAVDGRMELSTGYGRFAVLCEDPGARRIMAAVLSPLASLDRAGRGETVLALHGSGEAFWVTRDGVPMCEPGNIAVARHEVLKQLIIDLTAPRRTSAILHAAAVSVAGAGILIAGDCGRGKSTLTACLVSDGAGYIGDDLIPLEANGTRIGRFPVALSVKSGAWKVVEPLLADMPWTEEIALNAYRLKYVDVGARRVAATSIPVGAIVLPHYTPDASFEAVRIKPEETLGTLLQTGSRTVRAHPTMEGLCRLADRTPAWKLVYGDWREAARFIAAQVKAGA